MVNKGNHRGRGNGGEQTTKQQWCDAEDAAAEPVVEADLEADKAGGKELGKHGTECLFDIRVTNTECRTLTETKTHSNDAWKVRKRKRTRNVSIKLLVS